MTLLQVEHTISNFERWKEAFDKDPINRRKSGVKRYRILRPTDDQTYVIVHLEFDNLRSAQEALAALHKLWEKVEATIMVNPRTRMLDIVESMEL